MFASFNPGHVGISANLREGLALAQNHGFTGFDAQLNQIHDGVSSIGAAGVRDLYVEHQQRVGAWNLPFMPYRVTDSEWRDGITAMTAKLPSAKAIGAERAAMWIMPSHDELTYRQNFDHHVARFQPIARRLADHGMRLGLEFIGPETTLKRARYPFVRSVRETLELADAIGPNVGLLLDSWHWHTAAGTRADLEHLTKDNLVHIHVNDAPAGVELPDYIDNRRKLPGTTGVIDIKGFMAALARVKYDGPVTAEPFDPEVNALPTAQAAALTAKTTRFAVALAYEES